MRTALQTTIRCVFPPFTIIPDTLLCIIRDNDVDDDRVCNNGTSRQKTMPFSFSDVIRPLYVTREADAAQSIQLHHEFA